MRKLIKRKLLTRIIKMFTVFIIRANFVSESEREVLYSRFGRIRERRALGCCCAGRKILNFKNIVLRKRTMYIEWWQEIWTLDSVCVYNRGNANGARRFVEFLYNIEACASLTQFQMLRATYVYAFEKYKLIFHLTLSRLLMCIIFPNACLPYTISPSFSRRIHSLLSTGQFYTCFRETDKGFARVPENRQFSVRSNDTARSRVKWNETFMLKFNNSLPTV
jgi:hypothetical protein